MIEGEVTDDYVPEILVHLDGRDWIGIVDTGFNGDLELPLELKQPLAIASIGDGTTELAGGQTIVEERFLVSIQFDGEEMIATATFVECDEILVGSHLLRKHRLEIDFPARTVRLERVETNDVTAN
ncbi:MAG: hypothetical protein KY476_07820 [Planctomycetes bacterium]|nr:hypothetical protein [Planctomycetota bacterium]